MDPLSFSLLAAGGGGVAGFEVLESGMALGNTVTFTTTPAVNTLIIVCAVANGSNCGDPAGFTLIAARDGSNPRMLVSYKVSDGTETSATSNNSTAVGYLFLTPGSTLDVTGSVVTSGSNSITISSITPTSGAMVLAVAVNTASMPSGSIYWASSAWTELMDSAILIPSSGREMGVARMTALSDGSATGTVQALFDSGNSAGVMFSINPPT